MDADDAAIQSDLEYDPALYRRDRGDDWDTRSIASSNMLQETKSVYGSDPIRATSPAPSKLLGYDRYMAHGPGHPEIEMARLDIPDNQPLLNQVRGSSLSEVYGDS